MQMKSIRITLEITDPETVEAYSDCDESFIMDDIMNGNLLSQCAVVSCEKTGGSE